MKPDAPRLARWLIARLTPPADRDVVLGDLHEGFLARASRDGRGSARRWYWDQTRRSFGPSLRRRFLPAPPMDQLKGSIMHGFWQDVRFNLRTARRRPLVTGVAVASLTVGIALTTVVFTLVDAALLRPLPVTDPASLSLITEQRTTSVNYTLPYPDYEDWRKTQRTFSGILASANADLAVRLGDESALLRAEVVSGDYFDTLGVKPMAGRLFTEADNQPAAPPVAVISQRTWERLAGAETPFSARPVTINNATFTVIGITPMRFAGIHVGSRADVWVPLRAMGVVDTARFGRNLGERRTSWLWLLGRRLPGVSHEAAAADLNRVEAGLAPNVGRAAPKTLRITAGFRGTDTVPETTRDTLRVLLGASLLVLLVACANVANLLLARSADRRRELEVRAALGASRWRLVRLLGLDATLTALFAGALALAAAWPGARLAASMMAIFGTPMDLAVAIDWRIAGFAVALGLGAALMASLAPGYHVLATTRGIPSDSGNRAMSAGRTATRLRRVLLVGQFAVALALIVAASLLLRTVGNLRSMPSGFDTDHVALVSVDASVTSYDGPRIQQYVAEATRRLAALPGVEAVGFASIVPVGFGGSRRTVEIPGYVPAPDEDMELNYNAVTGDYFPAMGIEIVAGRALNASDDLVPAVVVVNETMAHRFWPGGQAVGRTMMSGGDTPLVIVGVARDAKYRMLREEARPSFYMPFSSQRARFGAFHVRTSGKPAALLTSARQAVAAVDPHVAIADIRTLRSQADANITDDRVAMTIGVVLAAVALLLAAVGLFGSMSYLVTQRTREIGIRVALGADTHRIHALVLRQGLWLAIAGAAVGWVASFWTTRAIEARLFGVTALDPVSVAMASVALTGVALLATYGPARRAARVDPIDALRDD